MTNQYAMSNIIYHNNFANSSNKHVYSIESVYIWYYGVPTEGNYWDDYDGVDIMKAQFRTCQEATESVTRPILLTE